MGKTIAKVVLLSVAGIACVFTGFVTAGLYFLADGDAENRFGHLFSK